ncbi:Serine/threonine-protein kinase ATM [Bienertia sinuspersici]
MQLDVVSGDGCDEKIVSAEIIGVDDASVNGTLIKKEVFEGAGESVAMDVGKFGERDSGAFSENVNDERESSGLDVENLETGVLNDELIKVEGGFNDDGAVKKVLNQYAVDQVNPVKENLNSSAKKLSPKPVNDDKCDKEENVEKNVDNSLCEVNDRSTESKTTVAISEKEKCGVHDNEVGSSGDKGVSLVVDFDSCVTDDENKGKKKGRFCASDLVWGKVKSHPWWPAQIFERGDASDKARKYVKSKGYLVCYFGDQTFAWNDEAKLKPFAPNFSQMVKQTHMEAFRHAVNCALDETSRRVEFGLSCHCIVDDVYDQLKTQVVENAGILKESRIREGGDRFLTASSFEPVKFLDYVKDLAQRPFADFNRLEHVIARAQLAAFCRWKGVYRLAEFGLLIGYVNNEADAPIIAEKEKYEVVADTTSLSRSMEEDDTQPKKRKKMSSDSGPLIKKVKCLSNLKGKKGIRKKENKQTEGKVGSKSILSSSRRQKETNSFANDSRTMEHSPSGTSVHLSETKSSFRVGESILRVAGQLNQPSPILKHNVASQRNTIKDEGNTKQCGNHNSEHASLDVVLSELQLAAIEPLKEHTLLSNMVTFISDFRNSIVPDSELLQKLEEYGEEDKVGKPYEDKPSGSGPVEIAEGRFTSSKMTAKASASAIMTLSDVKASCTNKTINVLEQQTSVNNGEMALVEPEPSEAEGILSTSHEMDSTVSSPQQHDGSGDGASEEGQFDEDMQQEDSPTALTLKFTDLISIPTEGKLNKIFSHFGPLKESETEVLGKRSCARVVFKRRSDAEIAFSSSGKFEIFGPSLVCYQLNYAPSPRKSSSVEDKRRKKDETSVEGSSAGRSILK